MSIGYANICSSVQDHRQIWYLYKVLEEQKRAKESTKRKLEASEEKCSWSDDVIKSKFVRSISSEARSPEAEVHQEMRDLKLQRLGNGFDLVQHCRRLEECYNGLCERIWKHWMLVLSRTLRTIVRIVQPLPLLLYSCLCNKTRITALPAEMFLQTRNAFEIDLS